MFESVDFEEESVVQRKAPAKRKAVPNSLKVSPRAGVGAGGAPKARPNPDTSTARNSNPSSVDSVEEETPVIDLTASQEVAKTRKVRVVRRVVKRARPKTTD